MLGNKMRMTYCIFGAAEMTSNRPKNKAAEITLYPMCHMNLMVNILKFKKETQQMQTNRRTDRPDYSESLPRIFGKIHWNIEWFSHEEWTL